MLRNVGIAGVAVGVAVTVLLVPLLETIVIPPINSYLYDLFAVERSGGAVSFTGVAWNRYMALSTALMLGALPVSFLLGGRVGGRDGPFTAGGWRAGKRRSGRGARVRVAARDRLAHVDRPDQQPR